MRKSALFVSGLALSTLVSGCVGTGPSTEQGALSGGALGALAGAVIGHNSRGGDAFGGAILGGVAGALAGGVIGNSVDQERGTIYGSPDNRVYTPDDRRYRVSQAVPTPPPTPNETMPPSPAGNAVWIPGYWIYDGRTYTWTSGKWEIPPPFAHTYVPAHSEVRGNQSVFVPGYWR